MYRKTGKRVLDLIISVPTLIVLSPVLCLIALLVRVKLGPPILFRQQRPGLRGQAFTLLKFRTMIQARDVGGNPLSDADRLTDFGKSLRSTSLDELPELFNVVRGDMSIVGPRPLLMEYLPRYSQEQARRHEIKPGLTGWAQINGRNALTWERKFALDVWYVENLSLLVDLRIIAITVVKVLRREGISEAQHATAREFLGKE
ncbi:MAG: sugar transferase [Pyrinomonadaceae bacterium]